MRYAVYHRISGEISRLIRCPTDMLDANVHPGESVILVNDYSISDDTHWVDDALGAALAKGDYPLDSLPLPCTLTIEGIAYEVDTQPEFEFDAPGLYSIRVDAGPRYLKKEFVIENTASLPG